jgi:hypothetical protein
VSAPRRPGRFAAVLCLVLAGGCAVRHPPPTVEGDPGRTPQESWALVLDRFVNEQGRIDFARLAGQPEALHHFVAFVGAQPQIVDDDRAALAFSINAYNALAMYNVIVSGRQPDDLLGFFVLQKFSVGGRYLSLYDYENKVIRVQGEPRVHFALNCMVRSCPRLPRQPFEPDALEQQLDAAAREFLNDPRHVRVDHERREVHLSQILRWYRKDFLEAAPTVIGYVNLYRRQPIPESYRVRVLDYDWSLNAVGDEG